MIQFNLLPDVKLEFIRAERQKHIIAVASVVIIIASLALLAFLIVTVKVVQPKTMSDLEGDLKTAVGKLQSVDDIDQILTVQNQLSTLTSLHEGKVVPDRLFAMLGQLTPAGVSTAQVAVDYTTNVVTITGKAGDLAKVYEFADVLKYTAYKTDSTDSNAETLPAAFSPVVLSSFAPDSESGVSFMITASFDPAIFSGDSDTVSFIVQSTRPVAAFESTTVAEEAQ